MVGDVVNTIVAAMISIAYPDGMAEPQKKNPLGPTGRAVADNIKRLRGDMQFVKLAARLEEIGRPIPTLGLRKIESYERRVDADDLAALAAALEVSPATLLMPHSERVDEDVAVTGQAAPLSAGRAWAWVRAELPLSAETPYPNFMMTSWPVWRVKAGLGVMVDALMEKQGMIDSRDPVVVSFLSEAREFLGPTPTDPLERPFEIDLVSEDSRGDD